jgi:hypothetical protein
MKNKTAWIIGGLAVAVVIAVVVRKKMAAAASVPAVPSTQSSVPTGYDGSGINPSAPKPATATVPPLITSTKPALPESSSPTTSPTSPATRPRTFASGGIQQRVAFQGFLMS